MNVVLDHPIALLAPISLVVMWLSAQLGASLRTRRREVADDEHHQFEFVAAAAMTLLGLIIGFTFSMALGRYDQRKNNEEAEANAIGTEYVRADLLPAADAAGVRALLRSYLDERILFYGSRDADSVGRINAATLQLQDDLWTAVRAPAAANPTPVAALVVAGMNDVLNSHGFTQAAWWNRIPIAAWGLMAIIAIGCNIMIGYGARHVDRRAGLFVILPLVVATAFLLIADIDSPRSGIIRVRPQNLTNLSQSFPKRP